MPSFLIFCHRFFELRFLVVTGILQHLADQGKLTVMLPQNLAQSFQTLLPDGAQIEIAHYDQYITGLRSMALNFLGDILYLTFPHTDILPNATAQFHRDHYIAKHAIFRFLVVRLSVLASKSKFTRAALVALFQAFLPKNIHADLITSLKPDVMIGCSFGMGTLDAAFLAEARAHNVTSAVVVQSWDRTSNKGYPTVHPDHALVWNEIMKNECKVHLEFEDDVVHVTGSPLWDQHFDKIAADPDPGWREKLGIHEDAQVIFFACGGFGSHPANIEVIPKVFDLAKRQPFAWPVHIVFRMYPQYLSPAAQQGDGKKKKDEIEALLAQYADTKNINILYPDVEFDGKNFMPSHEDHVFMTECLKQCDVSLSQVSSQMIEACIFGKPAINVEFGKRVTDKYDIEISAYKTEHLMRIYRTGAIYRVQTAEDLESTIGRALENPDEKEKERAALIDQEAPVHRGNASLATAGLIHKIALESMSEKA